jgi:hypothetical protein
MGCAGSDNGDEITVQLDGRQPLNRIRNDEQHIFPRRDRAVAPKYVACQPVAPGLTLAHAKCEGRAPSLTRMRMRLTQFPCRSHQRLAELIAGRETADGLHRHRPGDRRKRIIGR